MEKIIIVTTLLATLPIAVQSIDVYFGTYTHANVSEGIYHATFNLKTGKLSPADLTFASSSPTFLEIHPSGKFLYAVSERNPGAVSAYAIDSKTKKLTFINKSSSQGIGPCHLCISCDGRFLLVANYSSGSVASIPINQDGSLASAASSIQHTGTSVNPERQNGPHAHSINLSPDNRFAYVADLGIDKIMIYQMEAETGRLLPNNPPEVKIKPGAGPRHLSFDPLGKYAYLINELDETMIVFRHEAKTGNLIEIQTISTLPEGFSGVSTCAEVRVHPSGKFLYGSNRGHDSIVIYRINTATGTLTRLGFQTNGIHTPRNFNIDPSGQFCLVGNQDTDTVLVFRINQETGMLEPTDQIIKVGSPVCVRFLWDH